MASRRAEWNAWDTRSRRVLRPRAVNRSASAQAASSSPETTTACGPLTAARSTPSPSDGATSSSLACRATMAPPGGSACISRPRADTRAQASARERTPDTWAAASSPME